MIFFVPPSSNVWFVPTIWQKYVSKSSFHSMGSFSSFFFRDIFNDNPDSQFSMSWTFRGTVSHVFSYLENLFSRWRSLKRVVKVNSIIGMNIRHIYCHLHSTITNKQALIPLVCRHATETATCTLNILKHLMLNDIFCGHRNFTV